MVERGFRFGTCEVRLDTRELIRDQHLEDVEPRVFDLLAYLIEHAGRVVGKDELLDEVWGRRVVSESVVARTVMKARKAIGDDASEPKFIVTQHGLGYRFIGELVEIPSESDDGNLVAEAPQVDGNRTKDADQVSGGVSWLRRFFGLRWVLVACLVMLTVGAAFLVYQPPASTTPSRIVILPVVNATGKSDLDWARLGLMGVLSGSLASASQAKQVPVAEVTAAMDAIEGAQAGTSLTDKARTMLGKQLAAGVMIQSQLRKAGNQFRLDIELFERDRKITNMSLSGGDPVSLAVRAGIRISESLRIGRGFGTDDGSVSGTSYFSETYARALNALAQEHFADAARLLELVVAQGNGQLQPKLDLARALVHVRKNKQALGIVEDLITRARAMHDDRMRATALLVKSDALYNLGKFKDAESSAKQALALASPEFGRIKPDAKLRLSKLAYARLHQKQAKKLAQEAIVEYQGTSSDYDLAGAYVQLGRVMQRLDVPTAILNYQRGLELAQRSGRTSVQTNALILLADADRTLGDCTKALEQVGQAMQLATKLEDARNQARAYLVRGRCEAQAGQINAAATSLHKAVDLAKSADEPGVLALTLLNYANVLMKKPGTPVGTTTKLLLRAASLYEQSGQSGAAAGTLMNVASGMIFSHHYGQAESLLRKIKSLSAGVDDPAIKSGSLVLRAMLSWRQGHVADAAQAMHEAHLAAGENTRGWVETAASLIWLRLELGDVDKAAAVATSMASVTKGYPSLCLARARLLYEQAQFGAALKKQDGCLAVLGSREKSVERAYRKSYAAAEASGKREPLPKMPPHSLWL